MTQTIELGVDTFGDVTVDREGKQVTQAQALRQVVEQGALADQVGLDFFCVGEHHRKDFSVAAPEVVLAAIATRSKRIYLGSAVTVLSTDDPVRVFQRFSTLNAISGGRPCLRTAFYMAAMVAARCHPHFRAQYRTLRDAGKPPKVAIVATGRRLVTIANALIREDRTFDESRLMS